jgi:hypothetical protein
MEPYVLFWWAKMQIEIAPYVARCDTCKRVKAIYIKTVGPLQSLPIPVWKWEDIVWTLSWDYPGLQMGMTLSGLLLIGLRKFLSFCQLRQITRLLSMPNCTLLVFLVCMVSRRPWCRIVDRNSYPNFGKNFINPWIPSCSTVRPSGQTERVNQVLEDMLRACVLEFPQKWDECLPLAEFSYNNSYQENIKMAPFEALYGRRCRTPLNWSEPGERYFFRPDMVKEVEEKVQKIIHNMKKAQTRQKSYADRRRQPLCFLVDDYVYLKVSPIKGVSRFGVKGKLAPRYIGPFLVLEQCGPVAYQLQLPETLSAVHNVFHVSQLKKCLRVPESNRGNN